MALGWVAEWLCSGLQSRGQRFDSALSLHYHCDALKTRPGGEIGRRKGLKIPRGQPRSGSTPAPGTIINNLPFLRLTATDSCRANSIPWKFNLPLKFFT